MKLQELEQPLPALKGTTAHLLQEFLKLMQTNALLDSTVLAVLEMVVNSTVNAQEVIIALELLKNILNS